MPDRGMDHTDVLARLSPEDKARLTERSDRKGLVHLAAHILAIVFFGDLILQQVFLWPVILVVQGILLVFLFTLCHECTHKSPFRSPWINEVVGFLSGAAILLPFQWFRYFHLAHHRHTNDPENDPELAAPKPETWAGYILHVSGVPYWTSQIRTLFRNALGSPSYDYLPNRARFRIQTEARALLIVYTLALTTLLISPAILYVWLLPILIGQPFLRLYLLAEHGRCPPVANMLENTRTTFTNRVVRFLAWNMPYHIEHHSFPSVPFHALPKLHEHMKDDLVSTSESYRAFTQEYLDDLR